ncbi:amino acid ABC transporter substrate-binding protein (PAAT family) [Paraburkholderia sp. BL6665CI2N2]|uniref:ABC transporter substrate-binding protein n=1 Tax=Paraburkholderia sp. BL6665CI2N2 TaxID=1938806 RepID=UPI0010664440|nr:transporter substrate-binding domain-containing protein [Paraburkholderia sp. BL6665CI2N2]TDY15549.1 amino acid ABC transporter substrate-binding protein (PAAT family) [Paraburkholderia sp. BL6665CI2N2]
MKLLRFAGLALALLCTTAAHADEPTVKSGVTVAPNVLRIGMEITYPPFESYSGNDVVGADADIARALAKEMGLRIEFADTRFPNLILGLNAGHFDAVISAMFIKPERTAQANAIAYATTGGAILVPSGAATKPATLQDLCGMRVGVEQGNVWASTLAGVSDGYCKPNGKGVIAVSSFPSAPEAFQALMSNNVQAQLEVAPAAHALAAKSSGRVVVSSPNLVNPVLLGIYTKKSNAALNASLNDALGKLKKSGELDQILAKYSLLPPSQLP